MNSDNISYHKGSPTDRTDGVGILVNKKWKIRTKKVLSLPDRVSKLTLQLSRRYIIQIDKVYAPTIKNPNKEAERFSYDVTQVLNNNNRPFELLIVDLSANEGQ